MPYIPKEERPPIDGALENHLYPAIGGLGWTKGRCNYAITRTAGQYALQQGGTRYDFLSNMCALLEDAADEARQVLRNYEQLARFKNGDVPEMATLRGMISQKQAAALRLKKEEEEEEEDA